MEDGARGGLRSSRVHRPFAGKQWALLVGVSQYASPRLSLRFAHRDVEKLWELLQTERCGKFVPERARVLVNQQATTAEVTRALRSFLKLPAEGDMVLIFFSGHGAVDRKNEKHRDIVYFLTHDADPEDVAGSALPMREIMQSLADNLRARRVVMMIDACHSAAVEGGKGLASADPIVLDQYLGQLARSEEGFAILTSCEASEQSREDVRWGDGHGLFTHLVLEGLRGKADSDGDGRVTLGELFDYVIARTREVGGPGAQHPRVGSTSFDRSLPMAITGGLDAYNRLTLGRALLDMAVEYNDPRRFAAAARHLAEADRHAALEGGLPEARMLAGLAMLGAGGDAACRELREARSAGRQAEAAGRGGCPDAGYYLGIALAMQGDVDAASEAFATFAREYPASKRARLASALPGLLSRSGPGARGRGRLRALLIGVGKFRSLEITELRGPANDVRLLHDALHAQRISIDDEIVTLANEEATYERVSKELARMRTADVDDRILVSFSGYSSNPGAQGACMVLYDTRRDPAGSLLDQIDATALDAALNAIPARRKLIILDTNAPVDFVALARRPACTYSVLLAAAVGEWSREQAFEAEGTRLTAGLLTYALVQLLLAVGLDARWSEILRRVVAAVKSRDARQSPTLIGSEDMAFLGDRRSAGDPVALLEMSVFGDRRARSVHRLQTWYDAVVHELDQLQPGPFPELHLAFARALAAAREPRAAAAALSRAEREATGELPRRAMQSGLAAAMAWCTAWVALQQRAYDRAAAAFRELVARLGTSDDSSPLDDFERLMTSLQGSRPRALIVGIDRYHGPDVPSLHGAVSDAHSVRDALVSRCGVARDDTVLLEDEQATTARIVEEMRALATAARESPALFYFAGNGSQDERGAPTILGSDSRREGVFDIALAQLESIASGANLACVLDTDAHSVLTAQQWWNRHNPHDEIFEDGAYGPQTAARIPSWETSKAAVRFVPRDLRAVSSRRDAELREDAPATVPFSADEVVIGRVTIAAYAGHRITGALVERLHQLDPATLSWAGWASPVTGLRHAVLHGPAANETIFHDAERLRHAEKALHKQWRSRWLEATALLGSLIDGDRGDRASWLVDLGTAHALMGDLDVAASRLKKAIDAAVDGKHPEASYHLGRVLVESGQDLPRAHSELDAAAAAYPDDPAVHYYLGLAVRRLYETEGLEKARAAWRKYRDAGAPLGHLDEVEAFLKTRPAAR